MTTLTRESIASLSGRELDSCVYEFVFHPNCPDWLRGCHGPAPHYSHPDCRGLAEMLAAADSQGWSYEANAGPDRSTYVRLTNEQGRSEEAHGSTLPEAFARALLLAKLEEAKVDAI